MKRLISAAVMIIIFGVCALAAGSDLDKRVEHGYADSGGVKIHYASLGPAKGDKSKAPLIIMISGFLVHVARSDGSVVGQLSSGRDRPTRLQLERQTERRRELRREVSGWRCGGGNQASGSRESDRHRSRLGRHGRVVRGDDDAPGSR